MKIRKPISFLIYRYLLFPITLGVVKLIAIFNRGKLRDMVQGKAKEEFHFKISNAAFKKQDPIWIHAASGEIEYARPLMRELKAKHPAIPILVTYSSPSAKKILTSIAEIDAWGPLPWDTPWACHKFLLRFRPRVCLWSRTDVWPEMSYQLRKFSIPSVLFAATFAKNSTRLSGVGKSISIFALSNLEKIFCVSSEDQKNLKLASDLDSIVSGDTRFEQVIHRLQNPKTLKENLKPKSPAIVFGSTWPEDEAVIFSSLKKSFQSSGLNPKQQVILAPHEVDEKHLQQVQKNLTENGFSYQLYSDTTKTSFEAQVLLIDQIGILAELYTWGKVAFVGGSFKKLVHSVMEALAAGCPVILGPHFQNNREAILFSQKQVGGSYVVTSVQDDESFGLRLSQLMNQSTEATRSEIQTLIRSQTGASLKMLDWLKQNQLL